jgi:hypothetical protein
MSNEIAPASDFPTILRNSIHRETIARMVCSNCRQTAHLRIRRVLTDAPLPPVLVINAGVRTVDEMKVWIDGRVRFLEPRFVISKEGDAVNITSKADLGGVQGVTYELRVSHLLLSNASLTDEAALHRLWSSRSKQKETLPISSHWQKVRSASHPLLVFY